MQILFNIVFSDTLWWQTYTRQLQDNGVTVPVVWDAGRQDAETVGSNPA
jgi:hypothetical protein